MPEVLNVVMRTLHITSVIALLGGAVYARLVLWPGLQRVDQEARSALDGAAAGAFRPLVLSAIGGLLVSGLYNIFTHPGHSPRYHMLLGIKLLLALHVFASALLSTQPKSARRGRLLAGTAISGLVIVVISAYLRRIF